MQSTSAGFISPDSTIAAVTEPDFQLKFLAARETPEAWKQRLREAAGTGAMLVAERVIASDYIRERPLRLGKSAIARPLLFSATGGVPPQFLGILLTPTSNRSRARRLPCGLLLEIGRRRLLFGSPILPPSPVPAQACDDVFRAFELALSQALLVPSNVFRVWFFLRDIAADYPALNQARQAALHRWWPEGCSHFPSSTCVGAPNARNAAVMGQFWAYQDPSAPSEPIPSPLQCEPTTYGLMFSRVQRLRLDQNELLFISSTASIDRSGRALHPAETAAQLQHIIAVIEELLSSQGAHLANIVQSVMYCRRQEDGDLLREVGLLRGFPMQTAVVQPAAMWRKELVCEIEAIAAIKR